MADCASHTKTGTSADGLPTPAERTAEVAWLREVSALTVAPHEGHPADQVLAAAEAVRLLAGCARALLDGGIVEPRACDSACTACDELEGTCDVVRDIGALPTGHVLTASLDLYRAALLHACSAVFVCRRTLHPAGACLFSDAGTDVCGRVLAAAHRLG